MAILPQRLQEIPIAVELGAEFEGAHARLILDAVQEEAAVARLFEAPAFEQPLHKVDRAHFAHQRGVEADLVQPVHDVRDGGGNLGPVERVELHQDDVGGRALMIERPEGWVAEIAAIPIGLAIDLDRLEDIGQAGGGEQGVDGQFLAPEHFGFAGADIGGRDEEPHGVFVVAQLFQVERVLQRPAQRVELHREGVELIGRGHPGQRLEGVPGQGIAQVIAPDRLFQGARLHRAHGEAGAEAAPEALHAVTRAGAAALAQAEGEDGGIDGAGRGAGHAFEIQPILIQQPLQHAPGEGAMGAAALQGQVDLAGVPAVGDGRGQVLGGAVHHAASQPPSIDRAAPFTAPEPGPTR